MGDIFISFFIYIGSSFLLLEGWYYYVILF